MIVETVKYSRSITELLSGGVYDTRDDFTAVAQPFLGNLRFPATAVSCRKPLCELRRPVHMTIYYKHICVGQYKAV